MVIPIKKLKNGFELPAYGFGLWQMGGGSWQRDTSHDREDMAAIVAALDAGVTHFDTAEGYGAGHAEELLGKAIKDYDRNNLFIASKVSAAHQTHDELHSSFESSLKRLRTDYLDLYLLHTYPKPGMDVGETMKAMDELVERGAVKNIGVCNMTPRRFDEIQKHSKNKIVCNQVHYNVQFREAEERGVLKHAQDNDVMVVAWRPVQSGILPDAQVIEEISKKYNKTPTQVAINWLISQKNVVAISKTGNIKHLKENLGAVDWEMDPADIERIRADFPNQQKISDSVPLNYKADVDP